MKQKQVKDLKQGELFKLKPTATNVWSRGTYSRAWRKYYNDDINDIGNCILLRGDQIIYVESERNER